MGNITKAKVEFQIPTTPPNPYDWDSSENTCQDEETFFSISAKRFIGTKVTSSLDFGGFKFAAKGVFDWDSGEVGASFE